MYEIDNTITNDTKVDKQKYLNNIKVDKAWKLSQGEGVVVAVIDTGVDYKHRDLAQNIWVNEDEIPNNGIDDDGNGFVDDVRGWDFVARGGRNCARYEDCRGRDNDPMDVQGHGTHVSGIVAAVSNNEEGISGVAPKAKIMPLRAGYSTGLSGMLKTSDILDAITYAINNDADVINMSFAGQSLNIVEDVLSLAHSLGIVSVAASGNSGSSFKNYPAAFDTVISVGALSKNNYRAYFSNYGDWVDIYAPGVSIFSTLPGNEYGFESGTSMASPVVAGLVALIKSKSKVQELSADEVKDILLDSAAPGLAGSYIMATANMKYPLSIDEMDLPDNARYGSEVVFAGTASDSRFDVVEYEWTSDLDGYLSDEAAFVDNQLSEGVHTISLRARNALGEWSEPVYKVVKIQSDLDTDLFGFDESIAFKMKLKSRKKRGKKQKALFASLSKSTADRVVDFKWISSKQGLIGTDNMVNLSDLAPGFHKISLLVQDYNGNWSESISRVIKN